MTDRQQTSDASVPKWGCYETEIQTAQLLENPPQQAELIAQFISPTGQHRVIHGFWDGGLTWRVRFSPDEEGEWRLSACVSDHSGRTLAETEDHFICTPVHGSTLFAQHGPISVAQHKRHLIHADGTPFFWLADTAWNGPLLSTDDEWDHYLSQRVRQGFTAVQWVATQWRTAPDGDGMGQAAFSGHETIAINPTFFQRMDRRFAAITAAGLLSVPVMLWAIGGGENAETNPGNTLPEDQAILLARYMRARWEAFPVVWILAGDGRYFDETAERWRRIGRGVFAEETHAPAAMHCGGQQWPAEDFRRESWIDVLGYQSGHGDSDETLHWIVNGPPATDWNKEPRLFQINMEPPYENHIAYHSKQPHTPHSVRQATYWSLLNAPTAGVSYGGHGVWGWDDGTQPPTAHANSGIPLPWRDALKMPAAEEIRHLANLFNSIEWWRLLPQCDLLAAQPGDTDIRNTVLASRSKDGDLAVIYSPIPTTLAIDHDQLGSEVHPTWFDPRTGQRTAATADLASSPPTERVRQYTPPGQGDWLLIFDEPT